MSAKCTSCSKVLGGSWNMTKCGETYNETGRYLGVEGWFLYGGTQNWVYCYCKPCWQNQIKNLSFVQQLSNANTVSSLQSQVQSLTTQLQQLRTQNQQNTTTLQQQHQQRISSLQNQINSLTTQKQNIEKEKQQQKATLDNQVQSLQQHQQQISSIQKEIDSLKTKMQKTENDKQQQQATMENQIKSLQTENQSLKKSLNEYQSKTLFALDAICEVDNTEIKNDEKHDMDFTTYTNISTKHENIIKEWNQNTGKLEKMISNIDSDEKKNDDNNIMNGAALYDKYVELCSVMTEQTKRLLQTTSKNHIREVIQNQKNLAKLTKENKAKIQASRYGELKAQHETTQTQRTALQSDIKSKIEQCNNKIKTENDLNKQMITEQFVVNGLNTISQELQTVTTKFKSLNSLYNLFMKNNQKYIDTLSSYFDGRWTQFESKWWEWKSEDIVCWFKYKTKGKDLNNVDWNNVQQQLAQKNIVGALLETFTVNDFESINMKYFTINKYLMDEITILRNTYQNKIVAEIPSTFICPLTKQIMKDPVIAFDENIYERNAITEYLEKYNKSPVTGEEVFDSNLFPDMQLKAEIREYLKLNK